MDTFYGNFGNFKISWQCLLGAPHDRNVPVDNQRSVVLVDLKSRSINKFKYGANVVQPADVAVHENHYYISDLKNRRVVEFNDRGYFCRPFGSETTTPSPSGIDIDADGIVFIICNLVDRMEIALF